MWAKTIVKEVICSVRNHLQNIGDSLLEWPALISGLIFGLTQIGHSDLCDLFGQHSYEDSKTFKYYSIYLLINVISYCTHQSWTSLGHP